MATGTAGTTARQYHTAQIHYLRKNITFADYGTTVTIGKIPAGSSVIGGGVHVTTAFNSSGTDLLDVGFIGSTTDADGYATLLQLNAVGYIVLDELATTTNIQQTVDATVTCAPAQSVADASAGAATVIISFIPPVL
jgi:hypothetical protein